MRDDLANRENISDRELIERLKGEDISGYEILFHKYYPTFCVFIKGMVKDDMTAEDIAQNIFMKVWIRRAELDADLSIKNYLFVLAKHEVFNYFRAKQTGLNALRSAIAESPSSVPREEVESKYNLAEINGIVESAVEQMPEKRREIFRMSRMQYMSNKEIADRLGLSVRTVDKHIELALKDIRNKMGAFSFFLFFIFIFPI